MAGGISWFWNERFWLPANVTWADLKNTDHAVYPKLGDFYAVLPLAIVLLVIRFVFERCIAAPIGHLFGVKSRKHHAAAPNTILEKVFRSVSKRPEQKHLEGLAKQLDWSVRSVERWFRRRRNQDRPSILVKFTETSWRCVFYTCAFTYGVISVPREPWFWDMRLCWYQFPFHAVTPAIYNYYILEMSFYVSLVLSLFTDVRRKDFVPQSIHHFTTLLLISFSWTCNFTRIGCIVMVTHDVADIFLEFAKMCNYAKAHTPANTMFGIFTVAFFVSRIIFLPFWVIYSSTFHSMSIMGPFPAYYLFNGLLVTLLGLHCYWFYLIVSMAYKALWHGKLEKDARSDVDESMSDSDALQEENGINNHNTKYTHNAYSSSKATANNHH
ncbi:ceramide synthase 6-like [Diadema setosum]|uniref:ceramide synthase 6-like n=1 Tax=Diadema setosum TaxID=31175 RepID=UPI003B3BE309